MNWINDRIPPAALVFLLPLGLVEPPVTAILAAGDGGLPSFLLGFGLATAAAVAAALLARRHPGLPFPGLLRALLGRVLGTALAAAYALYWAVTAAAVLRLEAAKVTDLLLPLTPVAVIVGTLVLLGGFLAAHGVEPLSRWSFAVLPAGLLVAFAFYLGGIATGDPARLADLPPGGVLEAARGGWRVAGMLEEAALPVVLSGYYTGTARLVAATLGGMAVACAGLGAAVVMVAVRFGTRAAALYHWPAVAAVQNVTLPGFVVEKLDLVYLGAISMLGAGHAALLYLMAALTARDLLGRVSLRAVAAALGPLLAAAALLPPNFDTLTLWRGALAVPATVFVYALPLLGLGLSLLRRGAAAGGGRR